MPDPGKQSQPIPSLLIVEDGDEYFEFFERHLFGYRLLRAFHSAGALEALRRNAVDIIVMDIRFDRTDRRHLLGDAAAVGERHFGRKEDVEQAWTYLANRQGFLISKAIREAGYAPPILFIESLPPRQIANLYVRHSGRLHFVHQASNGPCSAIIVRTHPQGLCWG